MRKVALLFTTLLLCACVAFAQDSTKTVLTRDIGFNTQFIFQGVFNSQVTPFSIIYKKYTSATSAWRLGVDASVSLNYADGQNQAFSYNENDYVYLSLLIGKEFQKHFRKHWTWYYGIDLAPFYSKTSNEYWQGAQLNTRYEYKSFGLYLKPLLGIRYNVNERIYVAAEANLSLGFSHFNDYAFYSPATSDQSSRNIDGSRVTVGVTPASGLFLFYRF